MGSPKSTSSTQLTFENDYRFSDEHFEHLQNIIGASIRHLTAGRAYYNAQEETYWLWDLQLPFWQGTAPGSLNLHADHQYMEQVGDDVNNLFFHRTQADPYDRDTLAFLGSYPFQYDLGDAPFIISRLHLYGQSRTRRWSDHMIRSYFGESSSAPTDVSDYLLTNEWLILEDAAGRQLVFGAAEGSVSFQCARSFEQRFENDFYAREELDMYFPTDEEDFSQLHTQERRIKLHWEVDDRNFQT